MARFEIVGLHDCPWFAKAEKLADEIVALNPAVEFHKEMKDRYHWTEFCENMKKHQGWDITRSPVIFEVLIEVEGKACLIGTIDDFCEFAAMYFDIYYDPTSAALEAMAMSNKALYGRGFEGQDRGDTAIFNVAIVNAPLKMLELLLIQLLSPVSMIPSGMVLNIRIFDEHTQDRRQMNGLLMEVCDLASPILFKASVTNSLGICVHLSQLCIIAEDFTRKIDPTEDEKDWIIRVEMQVVKMLAAFNDRKTKLVGCRVLVGGEGPQCYIAEMLQKGIDPLKVGPGLVVASGQYIAQSAKYELGRVGNIPAGCISRIHAWGWPGQTGAYIEVKDAVLRGAEISIQGPGIEIPLSEVATNSDYIFTKFSKEFLILQKKRLKYIVPQSIRSMGMAESILNTIQMWLSSEKLLASKHKARPENESRQSQSPQSQSLVCEPFLHPKGTYPVINAGVMCPIDSTFPQGTFMVQPAICIQGKWKALGKISEKTNLTVVAEVNKLWDERQKLIYRDQKIANLFPDFDEMMGENENDTRRDTETGTTYSSYGENEDKEFLGESDFYTAGSDGDVEKDD